MPILTAQIEIEASCDQCGNHLHMDDDGSVELCLRCVDGAVEDAEAQAYSSGYDEGYETGYDLGYETGLEEAASPIHNMVRRTDDT